jgi:hypothetical protein
MGCNTGKPSLSKVVERSGFLGRITLTVLVHYFIWPAGIPRLSVPHDVSKRLARVLKVVEANGIDLNLYLAYPDALGDAPSVDSSL